MNKLFLLAILPLVISCNSHSQTTCTIPEPLKLEFTKAVESIDYSEDDFYEINNLLFDYEFKDSLRGLKDCNFYKNGIKKLFDSENIYKKTTAYRLIGTCQDTTFNEEMINRLNSDEESIAKQWNATALMSNRANESAEPIFNLFLNDKGIALNILINMYVKYDTLNVKRTAKNHLNDTNREAQILAIQCLGSYGQNEELILKLREFVQVWDLDSKGWAISALSMQKAGDLKDLLEPFMVNEGLINVITRALENSPTEEDRDFAKEIEKKN
jgi:hypothetical protein